MSLERIKRWAPILLIVALPFGFYWRVFHPSVEDRLIFRGDFLNQHYVWKSYALSRVKQGELPLWNPHVLGGVAFHANPQVGIFYPPTYLLLPFMSSGRVSYRAVEAYQLLHLALAGLGLFALLRALQLERFSALTASLIVMFTGFFTTPGHHALVLTASWIPLNLFLVKRLVDSPRAGRLVQLGGGLAALILAGHPQVAYYGILLTGIWSLWLVGFKLSTRSTLPALVIAVLVTAIQWLPTYRLSGESNRAETGYAYSTTFAFSPYFFGASLIPRGQIILPGQDGAAPLHLYVGVATLGLAFIGLTLSRRRVRWFFAGVSIVAILLSLGNASLLFDFFYLLVPGFRQFRIPYRLLGLYSLGMAGLAALGMEQWLHPSRVSRRRLRTITIAWWAAALTLVVWSAISRANLIRAELSPPDVERILGATYWAVFLTVAAGTSFTLRLWQPRFRYTHLILFALLAIDLSAFVRGRSQHPATTLVRAGERPVHRLATSQPELARHVSNTNLESYAMLYNTHGVGGQDSLIDNRYLQLLQASDKSSNILSLLNARYIQRSSDPSEFPWCGQRYASPLPILEVTPELSPVHLVVDDPLPFRTMAVYWTPLAEGAAATIHINGQVYPLIDTGPLRLRLPEPVELRTVEIGVPPGSAGVRIDDIELDLNPIGLRTDFLRWGRIRLNLHALPRAFVAELRQGNQTIATQPTTSESLECWTVHRPVPIDSESGTAASFFRKDSATIIDYRPEKVVIATHARRAGYLVLADTYHSGWSARVNGEPRPISRAFGAFRAVPIDSGEHEVVLSYRPPSLFWGAALSLAGIAALLVVGLAGVGLSFLGPSSSNAARDPEHPQPEPGESPNR